MHGTDANTARIIQGYAQGAVAQWAARRLPKGTRSPPGRSWCKIGCGSTRPTTAGIFSCPGLIVLIMTLIGAMLTALVMAREWERGTLEALFVTPVAGRRDSAGQDDSVFRAGDDRAGAVRRWPPSSCSMCRCADRSWCWPAFRCSICSRRWASAC